ncbi:MAG: hypothetical protein WB802_05845 [Candidatus Dormiibacterota bacterium]|jgi:uncharacterized membrane protein YhaH (DUF805 family)
MRKWALGIAVALSGAALIALASIPGLFSVAPKFNDLTSNFKPEMTTSSLAALRTDLNGLAAAQTQFTTQAVPALATTLGTTPAGLSATLAQKFPATATGLQSVPTLTAQFDGVIATLSAEQANFDQADSIPTASIAPTVIPWVLVVVGLVLIVCAVVARRWWRVGVTLVIGALLVATPLVLSLPGKATAADTMNAQMAPLFTAKTVAAADQSLSTVEAMGSQMQSGMLPALAEMLNMQPAQFNTYLAANFPALGSALSTLPTSLARFKALVTAFDRSLTDYNDIKTTQFTPIVRTILATGGFLLLVGLLGAGDLIRRRQAVPAS